MLENSFLRNRITRAKELLRHKEKLRRNRARDYDNLYDNLYHNKFTKQCSCIHAIEIFLTV
jgi:hypothetical protein